MVAQTYSKIKIRRSTTSGAPGTTLDAGELAYSGLSGTQSNGGDRLYIGINSTQVTIGGKYFTDMMNHVGGVLQTDHVSSLLTNSSGKIDQIKTTNLTFGGASGGNYDDSIRSSASISLEPAAGSNVHISNAYYLPNVDGQDGYVLTSHFDGTTTWSQPSTSLTVTADDNTSGDVVISLLDETLTIAGDATQGITTTTDSSNGTIIVSAEDATDTQKGVAKFFNTDFDTSTAGTVKLHASVAQEFTADTGSAVSLTAHSLKIEGDATYGVETSTGANKIHIQNKIATSGQLGVAKFSSSYFSVDGGGEVTSTLATTSAAGVAFFPAANFEVNNGSVSIKLATDTQVGVAKFDITNFTVSGVGKVSANPIYLGTTILELGDASGTNTDLAGMDTISVGDLKFENNKIGFNSGAPANRDLVLAPNGTGKVLVSDTWSLPSNAGSNGYALITNGSNAATWTQIGKELKFSDDSAQEGQVDLINEVLAILGDATNTTGAIETTTDNTSGSPSITISARTASTSRTGIASFSSDSFSVDGSGVVTIKSGGVTNAQLVNDSITFGTSTYALGDTANDFVGMDYAEFSNITIGLSLDNNISGGGASSIISKTGNLTLVGNTAVEINSGGNSFTLPTGRGSAGYVLTTDSFGGTSWAEISTTLDIAGDNSTTDSFDLIHDTLTFIGDNLQGLTVEVSNPGNVTFTLDDATTGASSAAASKGVSSFNSADFGAVSGYVSLDNSVIKSISADTGSDITSTDHNFTIAGDSAAISTANSGSTLTVSARLASTTQTGVASFDSANFDVDVSGSVTSKDITIGSTAVTLGDTTTTLAGLTQVDINNIRITGNTISSTDNNGNIVLDPNGTGVVDVNNSRITNIATPVDGGDAVNKSYADALVSGLDVKNSVRVISKSNIDLTTGGLLTIDGITLDAGDRVLVAGQTTGSQNGIYVVASGAWTRASDANTNAEVNAGMYAFVEEGTVWANSGFILVTPNPITLGTTALNFTQFSAAGQTIAGNGLTKSGDAINVVAANNGGIVVNADSIELDSTLAGDGLTYSGGILAIGGTADKITVSADAITIANTYEGQASIITLGTITSGTWQGTTVATGYGGTGLTTYATGDLIYASATNVLSKLSAGNDYQFLMIDPTTHTPVWSDIDGGVY